MADFSLTTLFVVPVAQTTLPNPGSTQDLTAGQVGLFLNTHATANAGNIAAAPYFYVAQGRENTYLQGSKKSDKIKGCSASYPCNTNVTEWYKVNGCPTPLNQITEISGFNVKCGDILTITLRGHSSYIDTLYFNGLTRSVTVQAPCCECDGDPCTNVDVDALIDLIMEKLTGYNVKDGAINWNSPISDIPRGINPDNISLNTFYTFSKSGVGVNAKLVITGKALTAYGQPCDVAAFPFEYDRMWFRAWAYAGPATTVDFIVADACNIIATSTTIQNSTYAKGTSAEIKQMEKNFYSYGVGYLKNLMRWAGYNQNFESYVTDGQTYTTFYIKFNELDARKNTWGDYINQDNTVIIACVAGGAFETAIQTVLEASLGSVLDDAECATTTTTTTAAPTTTTTTTAGQ